ncbi:hypothetical protein FISHEDRAFT_74440 [Fistulina hepatica ATCC 64428]|uniref:Uncharacterized protein n=1 Tax=Fistulina hepatica ATCC 64428 TaxID=1128425 RepID=A0A0D7ACG9_9AGAR|nr:hypothetical protein FISHEDRAFT_74440 [Fistulina hepatica ATCC 64428]
METPVPATPLVGKNGIMTVEESRAKRTQHFKNKIRNRGGIFVPTETRTTLLDILMGRRAPLSPFRARSRSHSTSPLRRQSRRRSVSASPTRRKALSPPPTRVQDEIISDPGPSPGTLTPTLVDEEPSDVPYVPVCRLSSVKPMAKERKTKKAAKAPKAKVVKSVVAKLQSKASGSASRASNVKRDIHDGADAGQPTRSRSRAGKGKKKVHVESVIKGKDENVHGVRSRGRDSSRKHKGKDKAIDEPDSDNLEQDDRPVHVPARTKAGKKKATAKPNDGDGDDTYSEPPRPPKRGRLRKTVVDDIPTSDAATLVHRPRRTGKRMAIDITEVLVGEINDISEPPPVHRQKKRKKEMVPRDDDYSAEESEKEVTIIKRRTSVTDSQGASIEDAQAAVAARRKRVKTVPLDEPRVTIIKKRTAVVDSQGQVDVAARRKRVETVPHDEPVLSSGSTTKRRAEAVDEDVGTRSKRARVASEVLRDDIGAGTARTGVGEQSVHRRPRANTTVDARGTVNAILKSHASAVNTDAAEAPKTKPTTLKKSGLPHRAPSSQPKAARGTSSVSGPGTRPAASGSGSRRVRSGPPQYILERVKASAHVVMDIDDDEPDPLDFLS